MDIRFDRQSLLLDRQRTLIRGAAFHYWRLPSKALWADVLRRIRAAGYNAVDVYYHWGFHSPRPNVYRFDGLRDIDELHHLIEDIGLFLIARPGPYICAETDGGGFPGWLLADTTVPLRCRQGMTPIASAVYLQAVQQWFGEVIPRIRDCANLIAFQIENEYMTESMEDQVGYMEQLYSMVRGFSVSVPLFHNGAYRPGDWQGAVDICGHDAYPFPFGAGNWRADAADALHDFDRLGERLRPACPYSPMFIPELQAGGYDAWAGEGYPALRAAWGRDRLGLLTRCALAQQFTLYTHYMFYGGTNWDFIGNPEVYTSYDYGAPIAETLELGERYAEAKQVACAAAALDALIMEGEPSAAVIVDPPELRYAELRRESQFLVCLRNLSDTPQDARLTAPPWQLTATVQPGTARLVCLGVPLSPTWRWASDAELLTTLSERIVFLVTPPGGATLWLLGDGTIVEHDPTLTVEPGEPCRVTVPGEGVHRLFLADEYGDYAFFLLDQSAADRAWRAEIEGLERMVLGPDYFVNDTGQLQVYAREPCSVSIVDLNSLEAGLPTDDYDVPGAEAVPPPAFGPWTLRVGGQEASPEFDHGDWIEIPATANPAMEQWGVYYGAVWYRTSFDGIAKHLTLNARHHASVYVNGTHVAAPEWAPPANGPDDEPAVEIALPGKLQDANGTNVLAVLVESLGHNKGFAGDDYRNPRGILSAALDGEPVTWRLRAGLMPGISGDVLGEEGACNVDTWPEAATADQPPALPADAPLVAYTSTLTAPLPPGHWAPLEIEVAGCPGKGFLAVNDTLVGRLWPAMGPQRRFVVPPAWLDANGSCEITLVVWSRGEAGTVGPVRAYREPVYRVTTL